VYNVTWRRVRAAIVAWKSSLYYIFECIFGELFVKRMRLIIFPSVAYSTLQHFSTLSHKRYDFQEKLLNAKYVFWFSLQHLFETFLILRGIGRDMVVNAGFSSGTVPVILVRC
jgi:hypothetical protein